MAAALAVAPEVIVAVRTHRPYLRARLLRGNPGTGMPYFMVFVPDRLDGMMGLSGSAFSCPRTTCPPAAMTATPVVRAEPREESALVEAARSGDSLATEELIRRHQARLFSFVRRMCRNADDAQDALQETFLSLIRSIRKFRGESQFTTWLFRIAINVCLKRQRRGIWDPAPGQELSLDELLPSRNTGGRLELADWSWNAERTLLRRELYAQVEAAIEKLPRPYRIVLMLRDVEGFSAEATANLLTLSVPAVKSRLHRARLFVRRELTSYFRSQAPVASSAQEALAPVP